MKTIEVKVNDETYEELKVYAKCGKGYLYMSDVVRRAVEELIFSRSPMTDLQRERGQQVLLKAVESIRGNAGGATE